MEKVILTRKEVEELVHLGYVITDKYEVIKVP